MDKKRLPTWLDAILKDNKRARWVVIFGVTGMILIVVSGYFNGEIPPKEKEQYPQQDYAEDLEHQLKNLLEGVDSVGEVTIMVTLDSSQEYVYAENVRSSSDETISYQGSSPESTVVREEVDSEYVFVDAGSNRQALKIQEIEPQIRGVVVVCQGADSPIVKANVTEAVTTSLGIGASQVCVLKSHTS